MKKRVYIETSIISYLTARPSRGVLARAWQQVTKAWWARRSSQFELFISALVMAEAGRGNSEAAQRRLKTVTGLPDLEITPSAVELAQRLVTVHALPDKAMEDALHIAVAAVHRMDYLLTWNCRHLDNAEIKPMVRLICAEAGFNCPEICTPQELMGEE